MELESDSLLNQFADRDLIKRTPQNDVEFAPLEQRGMVQRTLSGCWLLTFAGRQALNECLGRGVPPENAPPFLVAEPGDSPER